ncbi:MAG: bifunctional tetrahydrofolate synthase/dihydrofolate synthase [Gammaproteobacteria bacterium]|nr:bifunctional tetrahydrofolate synthase/dihydrofolate synthase [Gammaproteobacteria bacterium]MCP5416616.1 bifunctional tetrahydrofolate synthase/dihydrofolate synthase [Chromatiaceae bacterium]
MRFRTLGEWLLWQEGLHPKKIDLGLERVALVWQRLYAGNRLPFRVITVAGTNGKGSSVALLEAILSASGYRVGCFTSPHLVRYNERIRLDGREVEDAPLCAAFEQIDQARGSISLSYFEFSALAALQIFSMAKPDVVVLEVGLGGRLDAVNIVDPDLALITTIALDHTDWLGNTLDQIGKEKAGIMRSHKPVVYASPAVPDSLIAHARKIEAELHLAGTDFTYRQFADSWDWWSPVECMEHLPLPALQGEYQLQNAAAVIMGLLQLRSQLQVDRTAIEQGLKAARISGRFQRLQGAPVILLDVAHNPEAVGVLVQNLQRTPCAGQTRAVFGMMADKDVASVVAIMADQVNSWYLADLGVSRGMPTKKLREILLAAGVDSAAVECYPTAVEAFEQAKESAFANDRILVFGSFCLVGDTLAHIGEASLK